MVTVEDVRAMVADLPRSYEVVVRGRIKFRVGQIVYLAFSGDETMLGLAFPKDERMMLVETFPDKFLLPGPSDLRFNWVVADLEAFAPAELEEYVFDAWRMVVPKRVAAAVSAAAPAGSPRSIDV